MRCRWRPVAILNYQSSGIGVVIVHFSSSWIRSCQKRSTNCRRRLSRAWLLRADATCCTTARPANTRVGWENCCIVKLLSLCKSKNLCATSISSFQYAGELLALLSTKCSGTMICSLFGDKKGSGRYLAYSMGRTSHSAARVWLPWNSLFRPKT
jgi:hypothetical protein